ncbi:MAG: NAD-dependent epimerase/dehydratase family protein, partial [Ginsengibacter sp.]
MVVEKRSEKNTAEKQILVTGGSGLVGNELITQLLDAGERVTAIQH